MRKFLRITISVVIIISLTSCAIGNSRSNSMGNLNTMGNIVNAGLFAQQDDWLFFNHSDTEKPGFYKMKFDGTMQTLLNDDIALYIQIVDDWTFYLDAEHLHIYKIRTDGTQITKVADGSWGLFFMTEGWIFYVSIDDEKKESIIKVRTDGTRKTKIADVAIDSGRIIVSEGWIFYINEDDNNSIYKMRTDGTDRTKIIDGHIGAFNIKGPWIFYRHSTIHQHSLRKVRIDGTENTILLESGFIVSSRGFFLLDDWIYYNAVKDRSHIHAAFRIRTDGTDHQIVGEK